MGIYIWCGEYYFNVVVVYNNWYDLITVFLRPYWVLMDIFDPFTIVNCVNTFIITVITTYNIIAF